MNRIARILVILILASSCSKSANPDKIMSDYGNAFLFDETYYINIEISYEDAWFNILFALEDFEWPIEYESQTSGTIKTEMTDIGTNKDRYACRDFMDSRTRVDAMTCRLCVQVARVDELVTRIRIQADIRGRYVYGTSRGDEHVGGWWTCTSTGKIEGEIFDSFLSRVEPVRYVAPVYRREFSTQ
jgi:hypothetical protein